MCSTHSPLPSNICEHGADRLLVTGIGMANAKHAATLLTGAHEVPNGASGRTTYRVDTVDAPRAVESRPDGAATVVAYTIEYTRSGEPGNVIWLLDLADGRRTIANSVDPIDSAATILATEPIGRTGVVRFHDDQRRSFFRFDG